MRLVTCSAWVTKAKQGEPWPVDSQKHPHRLSSKGPIGACRERRNKLKQTDGKRQICVSVRDSPVSTGISEENPQLWVNHPEILKM